jgi:hypothetical protein
VRDDLREHAAVGLAAAFGHRPADSTGQSAGKRIGARAEDEPALEPYENPV